MMGWLILVGIGLVATAALLLLGVPRMVWTSIAAALVLAATGYAVQGSPGLAGRDPKPSNDAMRIEASDLELRDQMFGVYHNGMAYIGAADALLRAGEPRSAARAALGGVQAFPDNVALWTELGTALTAADGNTVSPAALYAFNRAVRLDPGHPGPRYFLGLAYVTAGQAGAARAQWTAAVQLSPENAPYRATIAERLRLLDQFMQMSAGAPPTR